MSKAMALHTLDYRVKGKVQGVFFRVFARSTAQGLGVVGWVKNEPVRHVVETHQNVTYMLTACVPNTSRAT